MLYRTKGNCHAVETKRAGRFILATNPDTKELSDDDVYANTRHSSLLSVVSQRPFIFYFSVPQLA